MSMPVPTDAVATSNGEWDLWYEHLDINNPADGRNSAANLGDSIKDSEEQVAASNGWLASPGCLTLKRKSGWLEYPRRLHCPAVGWHDIVSAMRHTFGNDNLVWPCLKMNEAYIQTWPLDEFQDVQALRIPLARMIPAMPLIVEMSSPNQSGCGPPLKLLHGSPNSKLQPIISSGRLVAGNESHDSMVGVYLTNHLPKACWYAQRRGGLQLTNENKERYEVDTVYEVLNIQRNSTRLKPIGSQCVAKSDAACELTHLLLLTSRPCE